MSSDPIRIPKWCRTSSSPYFEGDLVAAVRAALPELRGSFALGSSTAAPHMNRLWSHDRAVRLSIGIGEQEAFIASDVAPMLEYTRRVVFLHDGDLAVVRRDGITVFDKHASVSVRQVTKIDWSAESADKGGFEHYMRKEIQEQPDALHKTLQRSGTRRSTDIAAAFGSGSADTATWASKRILITGCGTSYHAGLLGKTLIEKWSHIPVEVDVASEVPYRDPLLDSQTLLVVISQSETADTLAALRMAKDRGASVLALCNVLGSTIAREADATLLTQAGPEIGVASTKAFTTQIALLSLLALQLGSATGQIGSEEVHTHIQALRQLPQHVAQVLTQEDQMKRLAQRYGSFAPSVSGPRRAASDRAGGRAQTKGNYLSSSGRPCSRRDEAWSDCAHRSAGSDGVPGRTGRNV